MIQFYNYCYLAKDQIINSVPCIGSFIEFHEDGKLSSCKLKKALTLEGKEYPSKTEIFFDKDGKFVKGK